MKKLIITLAAAFITLAASAQVYVGGSVGIQSNSDSETSSIKIAPEVGYALNDKMTIGAVLGLSTNSKGDYNSNEITFKPYLRYSLFNLGPVNFFADGAFSFVKPKNIDGNWELGVYPGIAIPAGEKLAFVAHLGALSYNSDTTFKLGVNNTVACGLYYNF